MSDGTTSSPKGDGTGFDIIVNARRKHVEEAVLTFRKVVELAFDPLPSGENVLFTVTYRNGPRENPKGTLVRGETVHIATGMIFDVTATDKS